MIDVTRTTVAAALVLFAGAGTVYGQGSNYPPPPSGPNPVCLRLEGQLAAIDRGGSVDPARADQSRRYDEAISRQQADLDRLLAQSRRLGCEGGGFFSIFSGQNPQCPQINQQVQQLRGNLDRMMAEQQRMGGGPDGQRQMVIAALAQNNCGPQYRAVANQERGFFESLFGGGSQESGTMQGGGFGGFGAPDGSATYRTLCVRTCDGFFFPVSFATTQARFRDDEQTCQRSCPGTEVMLFTHRNPGEEVAQAVSIDGKPYTQLATAFKYRQEFNAACSCRKPGQSWADALGGTRDMTVERGDIVVTEERAKAMSAPRDAQGRPIGQRPDNRRGAAPAPSDAAAAPSAADAGSVDPDKTKRTVRAVGPPFVPAR